MGRLHAHKGQAVLPEYIIIFFIVMTAIAAVTVYTQRALQGRIRDARTYMVDMASEGCAQSDAAGTTDCLRAASANGGKLAYQYEPYYLVSNSIIGRQQSQSQLADSLLTKTAIQSVVSTDSASRQLPPKDAR